MDSRNGIKRSFQPQFCISKLFPKEKVITHKNAAEVCAGAYS
jgi:hypothetical protein